MRQVNAISPCARAILVVLVVLVGGFAASGATGVAFASEPSPLEGGSTPPLEEGESDDPEQQAATDLELATVTLSQESFVYTGSPCVPDVTVELEGTSLVSGVDFEVQVANNIAAGQAMLTVLGKGAFTGECTKAFAITPRNISEATIAKVSAKTYSGKLFTPKPKVTCAQMALKLNRDYTLSYKANRNAGKATIVVKGKGNFSGEAFSTFTIKRASLAKVSVNKIKSKTYAAKYYKPKPAVKMPSRKLKLNRDYTLSYKANKNAGTAKVVVRGAGNYAGKKVVKFTIKRASLKNAVVSPIADRVYTGKHFQPKPAVRVGSHKLKLGRDYTLAYKRNRDISQAQVVVRGMGNYAGKTIATFNIVDWVSQLNIAKERTQLIIVEAHGARATVSMHAKVNGVWQEVVYTREGWVGGSGIGEAREGIDYTPTGVMYPDMAFGICGDPGCKMGYTQVDWSDWWCGDSYSDLYNQFVSTYYRSDFNMYESEHLAAMGSAYNYCLNMGWNAECTPHGGSAFFLHCSTGSPTGGCVSVPEWAMIDILCTIEPGCAIVIDTAEGLMQY